MNKIFTDSENSCSDGELQINSAYADKFLKIKKLEEVSSLKRKYKNSNLDQNDSNTESSSEEEDELGELLTPNVDLEIENTLNLLKKKDSRIYDSSVVFFSHQDDVKETSKTEKPFRIKDYQRRELLSQEITDSGRGSEGVPFVQEQQELQTEIKKAFKEAVKEDSENLFTVKQTSGEEFKENSLENSKQLDSEEFLREYLNKKKWMHVDDNHTDLLLEEEEEERGIEETEQFEQKYNFRFEEQGADNLITHSRVVKSTLRRKDDKRKRMREKKLQRKDEEKIRKEEELKRLKNLKKEEIMERLKKIEMVSGTSVGDLQEFLTRDFDPNDFDKNMKDTFGEDYYTKKDKMFQQQEQELQNLADLQDYDLEHDAEKIPLLKENIEDQKQSLLDDLYALDYEDLIGDLPVRFKYRSVDANNYGINAKEILNAEDKDLNEFLSLKKLAPYRSAEKRKKDTKSWYKHGKSKVKAFKQNLKKTKTQKSDQQAEIDSRLASYNL